VIVDRNVTRNIDSEFERGDWDVLVMHYLGVDHVGHNEGAKG
jgi:ethanolaminephosphotransferase